MAIIVKRPVALHVIVTEEFKEQLARELQEAADDTQRNIDQMDFQARRYLADLQRADLQRAMQVRQQIEGERKKQEAVKKEFLDRIVEAKNLELGTEFPRGTLESEVSIEVGDNLFEKLGSSVVVIKDGVITEIREG